MCNLTLGLRWVGWPIYADFPTFLRTYVNHRDEHEHLDYLLSNAFLILYSLLLTWIDCQCPIWDLLVTSRRLDCMEIGWHSTCLSVSQYIYRSDDLRICSQREFYQHGTADYLNDLRLKSVDQVHLRMLCGPISDISFVQTELRSKCVLGDVTANAFMGSSCMKVFDSMKECLLSCTHAGR